MDASAILQAGTTSGTVSFPGMHTAGWAVMATSAVAITVSFNNGPVVSIPSINSYFVEFGGDFQTMTVTGGTVSYIAMG